MVINNTMPLFALSPAKLPRYDASRIVRTKESVTRMRANSCRSARISPNIQGNVGLPPQRR